MSSGLRVLLIDDQASVRTVLEGALEEDEGPVGDGSEWVVRGQGFDGVDDALTGFRPDMVVLDLVEGEISDERNSGNRSFDRIRDVWFCPVVVYTGFAEKRAFEEHPLVVLVPKGVSSEEKVLVELHKFVPVARMIRSVHDDFDARIREALRDSVDALERQIPVGSESHDAVLSRAVRRQVAARVDLAASAGAALRAWERFLVPPLGEDLLTADLLRRRGAEWNDPRAFCMVLTPSCDLVSSGDRIPKVERVLVAWCEPLRQLGKMQLKPGKPLSQSQRNSLHSILTEGMLDRHLIVPEFRGHVPLMAVDLKRLELVEWERIELRRNRRDAEGAEFVRAASTDSPFREMAVWAYLKVTGRPGMPDTDIERWLGGISGHLETGGSA